MTTVYSIGHSNHSIDYFCDLLLQSKVRYLLDVRSVPFSRYYPQFNQERLLKSLNQLKIEYVFLGSELGGRIKDVSCYKNGLIPEKKIGYALHLEYNEIIKRDWFNNGIKKIISFCENDTCAIMCSEEDPEKCHRELIIGRRVRELGIQVIHIRAKTEKKEQIELF
jgi:uncharacterized protein (DUF488 family)